MALEKTEEKLEGEDQIFESILGDSPLTSKPQLKSKPQIWLVNT
jgi:hypothetical protein